MAATRSRPDRLAYWTMRVGEWAGMNLPEGIGLAGAKMYQRLFAGPGTTVWDTVAGNLSRVLGQAPGSDLVQTATQECLLLYGRYWYETFALRTMSWHEVNRRFILDGREHIDAALAAGRGVVLALPHMGNWDAAGHWLCLQGYRMTAVAEVLKPPELFELFLRHRRALGMHIVPLTGRSEVAERLVRSLLDNQIITLVADRNLSGRGVEVEMFGGTRTLPAGPAFLSLSTAAPLSAAAVFTTENGWRCRIDPPVIVERTGKMRRDVTAVTRVVAASFERFIASAPADWHMLQPAWEEEAGRAREATPSGAP